MPSLNQNISQIQLPAYTKAHVLTRRGAVNDVLIILLVVIGFFALACWFELSERFFHWASTHENLQVDELPLTLVVLSISLAIFGRRRMQELEVEIKARNHAEGVTIHMLAQNRQLARQLISLQEQERRHLARELHDEIGQYCVAIKVDASTIERETCAHLPHAHASALAIGQTADHLHSVVRGMLDRLRPTALDELGLLAALHVLTDTWSKRHRMPCVLTASGQTEAFGETVNITLYRIVQESLTNIAKHASACHVDVTLMIQVGGDGASTVTLMVRDDGVGLPFEKPNAGMGLVGMRERALALDGKFDIKQLKCGGTCLEVVLPVAELKQVHA